MSTILRQHESKIFLCWYRMPPLLGMQIRDVIMSPKSDFIIINFVGDILVEGDRWGSSSWQWLAGWDGSRGWMNRGLLPLPLSVLKLFHRIWSGAVKSKGQTWNFVIDVLRRLLLSEHPLTTAVRLWSGPPRNMHHPNQLSWLRWAGEGLADKL